LPTRLSGATSHETVETIIIFSDGEIIECLVRLEASAAVTMKNVVFCDIRFQFVPHRRHITSPLQNPAGYCYVRFEVSRR
jgi:hypothetical protein